MDIKLIVNNNYLVLILYYTSYRIRQLSDPCDTTSVDQNIIEKLAIYRKFVLL